MATQVSETTENSRRPCPACESLDAQGAGNKNDFEILVCRICRTIYTARVPSVEEGEDYDQYYTEANLSVPAFLDRRVQEIIEDFADLRQTNRLLDIGFGSGNVLQEAAKQHWEVFGQEVSRPATEQARRRGFTVHHGELADAHFPDSYFDVVTASEIVEHLTEPKVVLKEIARILRPGGVFWATTPYAESLSYRLMKVQWTILSPPEHVQLYSRQGMHRMLKNAGFTDIRLKTHGLNPVEIVKFYRSKFGGKEFEVDRVESGYDLNERLMRSPVRRSIKGALNAVLNITRLGDSLKISAIR